MFLLSRRSITARTLLPVAAAITLILASTTAGAYWAVLKAMEKQGLSALSEYAGERARRENLVFENARMNLEMMKRLFLERWENGNTAEQYAERFDRQMERTADGALRSRRSLIRIGRDFTTWVRRGVDVTPEIKRLVMVCGGLCVDYYPAWSRHFQSLYTSSPLGFNVGVAPSEPEWVWQVPADFDQNSYAWGRAGTVEANPARQPVWTPVVPDVNAAPESEAAYVTLCTPVDVGGRHLVTFHHDLELGDLIRSTAHSERPGVEHVVFRRDGSVIASPRVSKRDIATGGYRLQDSPDGLLRHLHAAVFRQQEFPWSGYDRASDSYVAVSHLSGPDWLLASLLPGPELRKQALDSARWVLWAGLGALALTLPLLAVILHGLITRPLAQLLTVTRRMSSGDTAARAEWKSKDELGDLAGAFNQMARNVEERDRSLMRLNQELEQRITERTEGLRQSEERFSRAFHGSHALLAILQAGDHRFVNVNQSFLRTFGYQNAEVIGRRLPELDFWTDGVQCAALLLALERDGFVRNMETVTRTRSGERRIISLSGDRVMIGAVSSMLMVGTDITERKQAEAEMRHALEREKELNELKDNFVAMVSHEFRTPLEVILSSTDILYRYFERIPAEQRAKQLGTIQEAVRRMVTMMDEVLLMGRAEAGRLQFHPQEVLLPAWCRRLTEEISSAAAAGGGGSGSGGPARPREITLKLQPFSALVMADESLLRHILTNLLSNALKYSAPDTPVVFEVSRHGKWAVFRVTDQGLGIPAADQPHLFDGFHRGSNVGQRPGTGLGLVIAARCAELHGGAIHFTSREGEGTVFVVRLPLFAEDGGDGPEEVAGEPPAD